MLYKPCRGLRVDCQQEATDKAGITGVSSKSLFKIHVIRPYVNASYINTQQCVLMCRLEKACKSSKTDTSAGRFFKYLGPYTQTRLQNPGIFCVREVIIMLWYCLLFVTKHEDISSFNGSRGQYSSFSLQRYRIFTMIGVCTIFLWESTVKIKDIGKIWYCPAADSNLPTQNSSLFLQWSGLK